MKPKGNLKRMKKPDFWPKYGAKVPSKIKEQIYQQYYSRDTLYVYCDMSMLAGNSSMAVACSYVSNASVIVKRQFVYPLKDSLMVNLYGELKAVTFALTHFEKYIGFNQNVVIYSDVNYIDEVIKEGMNFKKRPSLRKAQEELSVLYKTQQRNHPGLITVEYLPSDLKSFNPFYKSAHNAAKKMFH
ncbi:hypothetical protein [Pseudalkalibacillus sp. SCS-8]|uniref:hypothetical protein n=1 Tax=Pseudalkalibacillus nanhaiensis TaxID=3115291 RepID=UPI0032DA0229